jgi:hypothetical protein
LLSKLPACPTKGLAWETGSDNIHASNPGTPVEGSSVVPDWGVIEIPVSDSGCKHVDAVFVMLDVADSSPSKQSASKQPTACPGK